MRLPFDKIAGAFKLGSAAKKDSDAPVRIAVFVDSGAPAALVDAIREAFVPQTTTSLVRVDRLDGDPTVKPDTDFSLVLAGACEDFERRVQRVVIGGAPTVVLATAPDAAPFIGHDTPMLGLVTSEDTQRLLDRLATWMLDRTEKDAALAAAFPFLRRAAAKRSVGSTALTNTVTGALFFVPGADYPVITLAQLGMLLQLSTIYGKPLRLERAYEAAAVAGSGIALRSLTRVATRHLPAPAAIAVKAVTAGAGTLAMGCALCAVYERDIDYGPLNRAVMGAASTVRSMVFDAAGDASKSAAEGTVA